MICYMKCYVKRISVISHLKSQKINMICYMKMTCEKNFSHITFKKSKNKHDMLYENDM